MKEASILFSSILRVISLLLSTGTSLGDLPSPPPEFASDPYNISFCHSFLSFASSKALSLPLSIWKYVSDHVNYAVMQAILFYVSTIDDIMPVSSATSTSPPSRRSRRPPPQSLPLEKKLLKECNEAKFAEWIVESNFEHHLQPNPASVLPFEAAVKRKEEAKLEKSETPREKVEEDVEEIEFDSETEKRMKA